MSRGERQKFWVCHPGDRKGVMQTLANLSQISSNSILIKIYPGGKWLWQNPCCRCTPMSAQMARNDSVSWVSLKGSEKQQIHTDLYYFITLTVLKAGVLHTLSWQHYSTVELIHVSSPCTHTLYVYMYISLPYTLNHRII